MEDLHTLASFLRIRNVVEAEISRIIGRPAHSGHIGEYVVAAIFDIELMAGASHKAIDGHFRSGPLAGSSVNIKYGSRRDGLLNLGASLDPGDHPDHYLVLTGPNIGAITSKGLSAPWVIRQVFLFESGQLLAKLALKAIRPGVATSIRKELWTDAMIYPETTTPGFLSDLQREALYQFWGADVDSTG